MVQTHFMKLSRSWSWKTYRGSSRSSSVVQGKRYPSHIVRNGSDSQRALHGNSRIPLSASTLVLRVVRGWFSTTIRCPRPCRFTNSTYLCRLRSTGSTARAPTPTNRRLFPALGVAMLGMSFNHPEVWRYSVAANAAGYRCHPGVAHSAFPRSVDTIPGISSPHPLYDSFRCRVSHRIRHARSTCR